jgi:hypothetical protein
VPAGLPAARERLLRYCARPPLALERLSVRFYGVWAPHSRWRSRVVTATPKAKRSTCPDPSGPFLAPGGADGVTIAEGDTDPSPAPSAAPSKCETQRTSVSPHAPSAAALPRAEAERLAPPRDAAEQLRFSRLSRLAWATLYQRVFDIDPLECASCGGRMRFVEVIEDVDRARGELRRRNLPAEPPPLSRARSPDWAD